MDRHGARMAHPTRRVRPMSTPEDALELFPRPVMEDGEHTILQYGQYLVEAPAANRYAALVYMARDVRSAREMLEILAADPEGDLDNTTVHQALCVAAIVMYAKGFGGNNARKGLDAKADIADQLDTDLKAKHAYVLRLRDKYAAHDDGVGEDKERRMAFHIPPSKNYYELGILVGTRRIVSIGPPKANDLLPLFKAVEDLVATERDAERKRFLCDAISNNYAGITLTGRYVERELDI